MVDFRKLMSPEQRVKFDVQQARFKEDQTEARAMDDDMLASKMEHFLTQCSQVRQWVPGDPVYDSALFHVLVPEAIRRLKRAVSPLV